MQFVEQERFPAIQRAWSQKNFARFARSPPNIKIVPTGLNKTILDALVGSQAKFFIIYRASQNYTYIYIYLSLSL